MGVIVRKNLLITPKITPKMIWMWLENARRTETEKSTKPKSRKDFLFLTGLVEMMLWWAHQDSNLGQSGYEPEALPTEL